MAICMILTATVLAAQGAGLEDTALQDTVMSEYRAGYAEGRKSSRCDIFWALNGCGGALAGGCIGWSIAPLSIRAVKIGSAVGGSSLACLGYCMPGDPKWIPEGSPSYKRGFVDGYRRRTRLKNFRNAMVGMIVAGTCSVLLLDHMLSHVVW